LLTKVAFSTYRKNMAFRG